MPRQQTANKIIKAINQEASATDSDESFGFVGAFVGFVEDVNVNVGDCVGGSVGTFVGRTEGAFAHTWGLVRGLGLR